MTAFLCISSVSAYENQTSIENEMNNYSFEKNNISQSGERVFDDMNNPNIICTIHSHPNHIT